MTAPTTPLPPDTPLRDEREILEGFLEYLRIVLLRKAEGITDKQARRAACPPSDLTILGLVRHMTPRADLVPTHDRGGAGATDLLRRRPPDRRPGRRLPDATLAAAVAGLRREIDTSRRVLAGVADLGQEGHDEHRRNVRWILIHMVEEYARHCGHADLLREAIDGVTDD